MKINYNKDNSMISEVFDWKFGVFEIINILIERSFEMSILIYVA